MNLPTKLTVSRIIATFIVIIILIFPFYSIGFQWPQFKVGTIIISLQYSCWYNFCPSKYY